MKKIALILMAILVLILIGAVFKGLYGQKRLEKNAAKATLVEETPIKVRNSHGNNTKNIVHQKAVLLSDHRIGSQIRQRQLIVEISNAQDVDGDNCSTFSLNKNITHGEWAGRCAAGHRILAQSIRGAQIELSGKYLEISNLYLEGAELYTVCHEKLGRCFPHLTRDEHTEKSMSEFQASLENTEYEGEIEKCEAEGTEYCKDGMRAYLRAVELGEKIFSASYTDFPE